MKTIRVSEEVWQEIAKRGVFGETPDIVLKREFGIEEATNHKRKDSFRQSNNGIAIERKVSFHRRLEDSFYTVEASNGAIFNEALPEKWDKDEIRNLTENVRQFTKVQGGTIGQINASSKKLTEAGYHIYGPESR